MGHLSSAEIERYVSRTASVDEILAIAQHLDACWECRDKAAALVDDGSTSRRRRSDSLLPPPEVTEKSGRAFYIWIGIGIAVAAAVLIFLVMRH